MRVLNVLSQIIGLTGAGVIVWGFALIMVRFFKLEWQRFRGEKIGPRREALRHQLGSYLLLGLEILIAADILRTITHPTLQDMALLAGIVVQATFEPYFTRYPVVSAGVWGLGTSEAMGLVRDHVPPGETVCVDTATISYWTYPQFIAWYLPGRGTTVLERLTDERCSRPGA